MTNDNDYERAAQELVAKLGDVAARQLLLWLDSPDDVRADLFRQLHERGTHEALLDAMTDLEADPVMRGWLVEYLRLALEP